MSRNRVLVTGITGFIGRHVVEPLLLRGFEVHGTSTGNTAPDIDECVQLHGVDLLEPGAAAAVVAAAKPTHLLHLAWAPSVDRMRAPLANVAWAGASLALFQTFAENGGQRAVFAGSCAEYDWSHPLLIEDVTPSRPRSIYGICKNSVREVVQGAGPLLNVSSAWARLFYLYGPHEPAGRLVSDVCAAMIEGRSADLTLGLQERDYLHVADAAGALAMLVASDMVGTVNIASGAGIAIRDIANILGGQADRMDLLAFGRRPTPLDDPPRLTGETSRLGRELGFTPRFQIQDGLADTLAWWRRHLTRAAPTTPSNR